MKRILFCMSLAVGLLFSENALAGCPTTCQGVPQNECNSDKHIWTKGATYGCYWQVLQSEECSTLPNGNQNCTPVTTETCITGSLIASDDCL
jgi:hypothetical protein